MEKKTGRGDRSPRPAVVGQHLEKMVTYTIRSGANTIDIAPK